MGKGVLKIMAFKKHYGEGVPKGRLVAMYLTDEGNVHPLSYKNGEQMDLVATMISIALEHKVVVDVNTTINSPHEKISIIHPKKL